MCGIFGFSATKQATIKREKLEKITESLFKLSETRGKDASGLTIQNSNKISVYKQPCPASKLINSDGYKKYIEHEFDKVFGDEQT